MKQLFFLNGRYLGSREVPTYSQGLDGGFRITSSYVLVCPKCGEIWGRLMHEHLQAYCQIIHTRCMEHAIFPSEGTLSSQCPYPGDLRGWAPDWPKAATEHDIIALSTWALAHQPKEIA